MEGLSQLPEGFVLYTEWPEYHSEAMFPSWMHAEWLGTNPRGLRRGIGPLVVETYVSDAEPRLSDETQPRMVLWQRLTRTDTPIGWCERPMFARFFDATIRYKIGFARVSQDDECFERWAPQERTRRREWLRKKEAGVYEVCRVSASDFLEAYMQSETSHKVPISTHWHRDKIIKMSSTNIVFLCIRESKSGQILAGIAMLDSHSCRGSHYFIGFLSKAGKGHPVMTGLMSEFFEHARQSDFTYVHLGVFWNEKFPSVYPDWKGFSDFKAKFGVEYVYFPAPLFRFVQ